MSGAQIAVTVFGLAAASISFFAIWTVVRSPHMRNKPLWVVGCLFGFVGLGTDFGSPSDLFAEFGVQFPFVSIRKTLATGRVFVSVMFPVIAAVALVRSRPKSVEDEVR